MATFATASGSKSLRKASLNSSALGLPRRTTQDLDRLALAMRAAAALVDDRRVDERERHELAELQVRADEFLQGQDRRLRGFALGRG